MALLDLIPEEQQVLFGGAFTEEYGKITTTSTANIT